MYKRGYRKKKKCSKASNGAVLRILKILRKYTSKYIVEARRALLTTPRRFFYYPIEAKRL